VKSFNRVLRINPASAGAYANLATCYRLLGNFDESLKDDAKALELRPALLTGRYLNHKRLALVDVGRLDEARRAFDRMAADPDRANQAAGMRSTVLLEMYQGRYRAAIEHLESARFRKRP
jgi:tetratricopeptide (TPR) repeat protein